jgi:hypothetical protein
VCSKRIQRAIPFVGLALLFAFSLARFAYDVSRLGRPANDLIGPWVSSKVLIEGQNPYSDIQDIRRLWPVLNSSPECRAGYNCFPNTYHMVYPPSALPLVALLTLLPWRAAVYFYLVGSTALFVAMIVMLAKKLRLPWSSPRKLYMIAFALALAPLHAGIKASNLNTLVIALLGVGIIFMTRRPYLSGLALAIGICLKPQVAFLFFAYPWLRRKWTTAFAELVACTAISAGSVLWMRFNHVEWFRAYLSNMTNASIGPHTVFSYFYAPDPWKYLSTNLQVLAFQFTHSPGDANVLSWTLFLVLAAVSAFLINSRVSDKNEGIGIAIISVLTLLPVYQLIYTAAILVFVVYWAVEKWPLKKAKAALLIMLPLLLPLVAITIRISQVASFVERHYLGAYFLWNAFVLPHVVWIELFLAAILLTDLYRTAAIPRTPSLGR